MASKSLLRIGINQMGQQLQIHAFERWQSGIKERPAGTDSTILKTSFRYAGALPERLL